MDNSKSNWFWFGIVHSHHSHQYAGAGAVWIGLSLTLCGWRAKAHARGLKFGIYTDVGPITCAGLPASWAHQELDARTFAAWGVDYVKADGCFILPEQMAFGYSELGRALNSTGRPMVYMCEWPDYYQRETHLVVRTCTSLEFLDWCTFQESRALLSWCDLPDAHL